MAATDLASYPIARRATIANAGHYPIEEMLLATATLIQHFLATIFKDRPDA